MATAVWGLGRSGMAAARLLAAQVESGGKSKSESVRVCDQADTPMLRQRALDLAPLGIQTTLGQPLVADQVDRIVVSPGISWQHPELAAARSRGVKVIGEAELAWQVLGDRPWIVITGTNGKTTTTALVAAIWQAAGWQAPACGNIGLPLCEVALEAYQTHQAPDWIIAELSSYQIEASPSISPAIGIWTTFTPDHLERHGSLAQYAALKASVIRRSRLAILNGADPYLAEQQAAWPDALWCGGAQSRFSINADQWLCDRDQPLLPLSESPLLGEHNQQNLMLAVAAAHSAAVHLATMREAIQQFQAPPHRLEPVRTVNSITFINDSKATNYDAALVGLKAIATPVVLIAGGQAKQGDDQAWLAEIQARCQAVILIGAAAAQFGARLTEVGYNQFQSVPGLAEAVPLAAKLAPPGSTVLFSPACASFDQYANYEERGDHFRSCCVAL